MTIGENIRQLREASQLTQAKLAEKLGVTEQAASKWENGNNSPDAGIIPRIASLFQVSTDRLFGFRLGSYDAEIAKIIGEADKLPSSKDAVADLMQRVDFLAAALISYPNSDKLKMHLAWYYSMAARNVDDNAGYANKATQLCHEVLDTSKDTSIRDEAHFMLSRIYCATQQPEKALAELDKITTGNDYQQAIARATILFEASDYSALQKHVEKALWECYLAMSMSHFLHCNALSNQGKYAEAIAQFDLHDKILSLFDSGGGNLGLFGKMNCQLQRAFALKNLGKKSDCTKAIEIFVSLGERAKTVASHKLSDLNKYFPTLAGEEYVDGHMKAAEIDVFVATFKGKFDDFLS
ncbi:MAG: helix-turn-helix domain-containing protein [Defluviitaleaceae bacterium]|nr:helix-turn-helix domain-containing protein [Defluviitaleaceae bacterium]